MQQAHKVLRVPQVRVLLVLLAHKDQLEVKVIKVVQVLPVEELLVLQDHKDH